MNLGAHSAAHGYTVAFPWVCGLAPSLLWAYYQIILGEAIPYPSTADILWAIGYIPIAMGLVVQYRALGVATSRRLKLIVLGIYSVILAITFSIVLWPIISSPSDGGVLETLLSLYYPVADLILAYIATLSLLVLWGGLVGQPWRYILVGILLFAAADVVFAYGAWTATYESGTNLLSGFVDVVYLSAYVVIAAGAYRQLTLRLPTAG